MESNIKGIIMITTLLLSACGLSDPDQVAYRQVIVPLPTDRTSLWNGNPTLDVTTNTVKYL